MPKPSVVSIHVGGMNECVPATSSGVTAAHAKISRRLRVTLSFNSNPNCATVKPTNYVPSFWAASYRFRVSFTDLYQRCEIG